jgi:DNA-binding NarL/FixJ family response regulator
MTRSCCGRTWPGCWPRREWRWSPPPTFTDEGLRAADLLRTRHPGTAILVLSQYLDAGYALRLLESFPGGVGYLLKDRVSRVAVLIDAVERVVAGECVLTSRERDVLTDTPEDNRRVLAVLAFLRP